MPILRWIDGPPHQRRGLAVLQRAIAIVLLFRLATEAPFAGFLWGPNSIALGSAVPVLGPMLGGWADRIFDTEIGTLTLLAVLGAAALGLLFQAHTRVCTCLAWAAFTLIGFRLHEINDGGDNITTLLLMYMTLALPARAQARAGSLRAWFHNLAVLAIGIQVCILYFTAGFMKMHGDVWNNGTALYIISQVEWFSLPSTRWWFTNPLVVTVATYSTMLFQVWFPIALFSRFKLAFVVIALGFHVGIAVTMGLLTFSLVMAGADIFFVTDAERESLHTWRVAVARRLTDVLERWWRAEATLFIDGDCGMCRAFGSRVRRLDIAGRFLVKSFRDSRDYERYGIASEQLERRMHLVIHGREGTRVIAGFGILRMLIVRLPALWPMVPFFPLLGVLARTGVGDMMYDSFASRRRISPGISPGATLCEGHCGSKRILTDDDR